MADLKDIVNNTFEIIPGLLVARRINIDSIEKAERKYGKPFSELEFKWMKDFIFLIKVLVEQADPQGKTTIPETKVRSLINKAIENGFSVGKLGDSIAEVMGGEDSKNFPKPNRKERRRKG